MQKSARCGPTLLVFTGHRTRALRRSSARSGRPRGGARFTFTTFGDQATPTLGKKYQPPEGVTIAKPPYVNDGLGSPAAAGTVLGVERVQPLFHLLNGDLCYANVAEDRVGTWWDFWENNSRSARKRPCWGGRPPTASSVPGCECLQSQPREAVHMTIIRIGLDTSKHVFQIHGVDENEHVVLRRQIRRSEVAKFFAKLAPTRIGIEACGASHYWARVLRGLGHEMVLLPPQYIKPYVKRGKNDKIDAEAICEAMSRPTMRFVPVKSAERQAALTMLGVRDLLVKQRTMLINAIRGHAAEFGLTVAKGPKQMKRTAATPGKRGRRAGAGTRDVRHAG